MCAALHPGGGGPLTFAAAGPSAAPASMHWLPFLTMELFGVLAVGGQYTLHDRQHSGRDWGTSRAGGPAGGAGCSEGHI